MTDANWKRLADYIVARRLELGMRTTTALAERAELTPRAMSDVENARRTNYTKATKAAIERALDWTYGSVDDVLAGYEPTTVEPGTPDDPPLADAEWRYPQIRELVLDDIWQTADDLAEEVAASRASPDLAEAAAAVIKALSFAVGELLIEAGNDGRITPLERSHLLSSLYERQQTTLNQIGEEYGVADSAATRTSPEGGQAQKKGLNDPKPRPFNWRARRRQNPPDNRANEAN